MKPNETLLKIAGNNYAAEDELDDENICSSGDTPLRKDSFAMDDDEKIALIAYHFT